MSAFAVTLTLVNQAFAAQAEPFSDKVFAETTRSGKPFVVAFHSDSCGSCKVQKPNLESALLEAPLTDVRGLMANFEATKVFRQHLQKPVRGPSTILVFKNGLEIGRILGETNKEKIKNIIQEAIAKN